MNTQTKLVFALEHIAHLFDLIEENPKEESLRELLIELETEFENQLHHEIGRKRLSPR